MAKIRPDFETVKKITAVGRTELHSLTNAACVSTKAYTGSVEALLINYSSIN